MCLMAILFWGCISHLLGQEVLQTNQVVAATNAIGAVPRASGLFLLEPSDNLYSDRFVLTRNLSASGPLVAPARAKSFSDFARRVVNLVNPFAAGPGLPAPAAAPMSSRAWSSVVGWSPGASAFPTEAHHEPPMLRLVSFSVEKQP
jgi:hypothetical protein